MNRERGKYIDIKDRKLARKVELRGIKKNTRRRKSEKDGERRRDKLGWGHKYKSK